MTLFLSIIYWFYLLSTLIGSLAWYLLGGLIVFGIIKLFALIFGFGGGFKVGGLIGANRNAEHTSSTRYHTQVMRSGQWVNISGHYNLTSAYKDADYYERRGERTRVVDSDGFLQ